MSLYIPKMSDTPGVTIPGLASNFNALADSQIVEQGSNANGEYIRWANGLQVCFRRVLPFSFQEWRTTLYTAATFVSDKPYAGGGSWGVDTGTVSYAAQLSGVHIYVHTPNMWVVYSPDMPERSGRLTLFMIGWWK